MQPQVSNIYRYEFFVGGNLQETGLYKYLGESKNGRWYRFQNCENEKMHLVEKNCFPVHSWVIEKQVEAKSIFHI